MKRMILGLSFLSLIAVTTVSCDKEDKNAMYIEQNNLPTNAISFLSTNFNGVEVLSIKKLGSPEKDGTLYELQFKNGGEIDFNEAGNWVSVEANGNSALPTGFILPTIVAYVSTNYSTASINQIEKISTGYEVDLTNDVDLVFDNNGQFVRIDN